MGDSNCHLLTRINTAFKVPKITFYANSGKRELGGGGGV
jgi:hypothetical protein